MCTFQILPFRSFEKISDPVKFDFNVYIVSAQKELYLNTENNDGRVTLVGTHDKDITWMFSFYDDHLNTENDTIRDRDLVYLVNSKGDGLLTVKRDRHQHNNRSLTASPNNS